MNVYEIDCLHKKFDIILFFRVYYHLSNPISAFEHLASITNESLFLSGHILSTQEPLMYYYGIGEEEPHRFSYSVASPSWLHKIAKTSGFKMCKTLDIMSMSITEKYPHMIFGDTYQKVGIFEFCK